MNDHYFKDRETSERAVFERLLSRISKTVPDELLSFAPYMSFVMLKPDAYLRGLVPDILAYLADNQVYPIRFRLEQLKASHIDDLYRFVKPKYQESWWIMEKIYRLAPCCPCIVIGEPKEFPHLSARIRDLVGPTTPLLGDESHIRYRFRGAHRIFNLIHGTDDPAAAIREALVFFELDEVREVLEKASTLPQGTPPNWAIPREGLIPPQKVELDYPQAKYNLKLLLHGRCDVEIRNIKDALGFVEKDGKKEKAIDRLQSLLVRLAELLRHELKLLDEHRAPKEERKLLINVYYLQLRTYSLAKDSISEAITWFARDSSLRPDDRTNTLSSLAVADRLFDVIRVLTTDQELKESPFDKCLSSVASLDIRFDRYDEANLHAAWSVLSTEFVDLELKYPEQPF